jgi:hypothetical protein
MAGPNPVGYVHVGLGTKNDYEDDDDDEHEKDNEVQHLGRVAIPWQNGAHGVKAYG